MPNGKILVAVLNWGLGHATRCIPIIQELQRYDFQPIIASDGKALAFLRNEFPDVDYYKLTAVHFSFSQQSTWNYIHLLSKAAFWNKALKKDKQLIEKIHLKENLCGIISDSRPYCYHRHIPGVYITHQLQVKSGIFTTTATAAHRGLIGSFNECWVPDRAAPHSICGKMSEWKNAKLPLRYINIQSDLKIQKTSHQYDYTGIISGAEPERSKLEQKMIAGFSGLKGKKIIIAGNKKLADRFVSIDIEIKGLASRAEVQHIINSSKTIIARGGYSTMMDLLKLQKPALLIPTPGQTEQLYLTQRLKQLNYVDVVSQEKLSATRILQFENNQHKLDSIAFTGFDFSKVFGLFKGK